MFVVAVTGGIACGKSSVSNQLHELLGEKLVASFDCDDAVADLLTQGDVIAEIATLGLKFNLDLASDVGLNRSLMRKGLFESQEFRSGVEEILHPLVLASADSFVERSQGDGKILLLEVPLLFEVEFPVKRDMVLVIAASPLTQLRRLTEVRSLDSDLAQRMLDSQMSIEEKVARGDVVVWNDGSVSSLHEQLEHLAARFNLLVN